MERESVKRHVREKEVIEEVRRETNAVSRQVLSEDIGLQELFETK